MNVDKTQVMFLGRRSRRKEMEHALLVHQGTLTAEPKVKFLGVIVDKDLNWSEHVGSIRRKCLAGLRRIFLEEQGYYCTIRLVLPHLDYCSCVCNRCGVNLQMKLERIQNYAMRLITSVKPRTHS